MFLAKEKVFRTGSAIYRCSKELGKGQTATVYHAIREDNEGHTRQVVALKVVNHPDFVQSLRHEFDVLTRMGSNSDSNTCAKVLSWENVMDGETSVQALVLEWIEGATLSELHQDGILQVEWADEIARQIEIGLQELEANGLYHGDISPSNVMIDRRGRVRLIDFATDNNLPSGTLNYVPPERWAGAALSIETDLFALGLLHYDLQTEFSDLAKSETEAQNRSLRLSAATAGSRLSRDPDSRDYAEQLSNAAVADEMSAQVLKFLRGKCAAIDRTRPLEVFSSAEIKASWPFRIAAAAALMISISIAVQAEAPRGLSAPMRGELLVATHSWIHLSLNGRDIGYSPIRVHRLLPGTHRIHWQNANKSGEIQINLAPGALLKLSDGDFSKLE